MSHTDAEKIVEEAIDQATALFAPIGGAGGALDDLSDVAITTPATGHILRHNGTQFVNALGTTHFAATDDARLDDARTPTAHKASHENGGGDEISVAGLSGVLADPQPPIIGAGATQAVAGNDARLTDSRTPSAHAASHQNGGGDEISVAGLSGVLADPQPPIIGAGAAQAVAGNDARLTDSRTPTAHTHPWADVTGEPTTLAGYGIVDAAALVHTHAPGDVTGTAVVDADSRLSDDRTPLAHKASHENGGSDEISVAGLSGLLADAQTPLSHTHLPADIDEGADGEVLTTVAGVTAWATPAGSGISGTGTINFGARTAARSYAEVELSGLSGLSASSHLNVFMQGDPDTADHSIDEHMVEPIALRMKYLTATTARVIGQVDRGRAWGDFTFHYLVS